MVVSARHAFESEEVFLLGILEVSKSANSS